MRFHHSTRRGRNRLGHSAAHSSIASQRLTRHSNSAVSSCWSQLGYCRETNIHFNRRLPVELPTNVTSDETTTTAEEEKSPAAKQVSYDDQLIMMSQRLSLDEPKDKKIHATSQQVSTSQRRRLQREQAEAEDDGQEQGEEERDEQLTLRQEVAAAISSLDLNTSADGIPEEAEQTDACGDSGADQQQPEAMDLDSARQKLVAQVGKHPFWSNKAARRMRLTSSERRLIYIYELISFCERRDLEWRYEPYRGVLVPSLPFRRLETYLAASAASGCGDRLTSAAAGSGQPEATATSRSCTVVPRPRTHLGMGAGSSSGMLSGRRTLGSDSLNWTSVSSSSTLDTPPAATGSGRGSPPRAQLSQRRSPARSLASTSAAAAATARAAARQTPSPELVWSIEPPAQLRPAPFTGQLHSSELPGSSFVKRCHGCQGRGRLKCASCFGAGYEVCISCSGRGTTRHSHGGQLGGSSARGGDLSRGYRNSSSASGGHADDDGDCAFSSGGKARGGQGAPGGITHSADASGSSGGWLTTESCHFCHGAGQKRCWVCAGKSYNNCEGCLGLGQLRCYLQLNIYWTNHRDECVLNNADQLIPGNRLRLATGLLLADETGSRLAPLSRSSVDGATSRLEDANQLHLASRRLIENHEHTFQKQERLIRQRQKVTRIECHKVNFEWKQRRGHFVIYGDERKVYIAKYPFKTFCSIT